MSVSLTLLSCWNWSNGKEKQPIISNGSSSDTMKLCSKESKLSSSQKLKKKWKNREERKRGTVVDKEYDIVLVASDDGGVSEQETSYDSDWSIGWMEPHASDFSKTDDENDFDAFAVLVPCYRNHSNSNATFKMEEVQQHEQTNQFLNVVTSGFPAVEGNKYMDQWLASLQSF